MPYVLSSSLYGGTNSATYFTKAKANNRIYLHFQYRRLHYDGESLTLLPLCNGRLDLQQWRSRPYLRRLKLFSGGSGGAPFSLDSISSTANPLNRWRGVNKWRGSSTQGIAEGADTGYAYWKGGGGGGWSRVEGICAKSISRKICKITPYFNILEKKEKVSSNRSIKNALQIKVTKYHLQSLSFRNQEELRIHSPSDFFFENQNKLDE